MGRAANELGCHPRAWLSNFILYIFFTRLPVLRKVLVNNYKFTKSLMFYTNSYFVKFNFTKPICKISFQLITSDGSCSTFAKAGLWCIFNLLFEVQLHQCLKISYQFFL